MIPKTILVQGVIIALLALCLFTMNASLMHCRVQLNYQFQKDDQSQERLRQLAAENARLKAALDSVSQGSKSSAQMSDWDRIRPRLFVKGEIRVSKNASTYVVPLDLGHFGPPQVERSATEER